jgi:tRNA threonylcarbamoyladenosine modification (KEOPS) complex  Pcc1 subunit
MKHAFLSAIAFFIFATSNASSSREIYQLIVYHFNAKDQESRIDQYLKDDLLPFLHTQKIKSVGVFFPIANDTATDKKIYVLVPIKDLDKLPELQQKTAQMVSEKSSAYSSSLFDNPPYTRMENIIIQSWEMYPTLQQPRLTTQLADHIYELRSYESATEQYYRSKVKMFNQGGEIFLFARLQFNAVFYGDVIAGSRMPNLMYMTSFDNMASREAHWKSFKDDAKWKELSANPEYQHNVKRNETILMRAKLYSDY